MTKSTIFVLLLASLGVVAALGLVALDLSGEAPAPSTGAAPTATRDPGAAQALRAIRREEMATLASWAAQLGERQVIGQWLDPSLAARPSYPQLRPDTPPQPFAQLEQPSPEALEAAAREALEAEVKASQDEADRAALGALSIYVAGDEGVTRALHHAAAEGASAPEARIAAWLESMRDAPEQATAVMETDGGLHDVFVAPVRGAASPTWVVGSRPIDADLMARYRGYLGAPSVVALVQGGAVVAAASADGEAGSALEAWSGEREDFSSAQPTASSFVVEGRAALSVDVLPLNRPGRSTIDTALVIARPVAATVDGAAPAPLMERIEASPLFSDPGEHALVLAAAAGAVLLLTLLGWALARADAEGAWRRVGRRLEAADGVNDVPLKPHQREVVQRAHELGRASAPTAATAAPPPDAAPEALAALRTETTRLTQDLESARAKSRQLEEQLGFARRKVSESERQQQQSEAARAALQDELKQLKAARPAAGGPPAAPPAAPPSRRTQASAEEEAAPTYDTAEVSDEGMAQLLEGFEQGERPRPRPTSETLTEVAERLGAMSEVEARRLPRAAPPVLATNADTFTGEDAPTSESASPFAEEGPGGGGAASRRRDPRRVTATGFPSPLQVQSYPTPHHAVNERDVLSSSREVESASGRGAGGGLTEELRSRSSGDSGDGADASFMRRPRTSRASRQSLAAVPQALSPAGLLEALKRRGKSEETLTQEEDDDPATRVAPVARELLEQSRPPSRPETLSHSGVFSRTGSKVDIPPSNDSEYFKALYERFLETKRKCNESTDNITLERFVNRLARNKKALMDRYSCRTVRFQVYVKDGRAALKATPVK